MTYTSCLPDVQDSWWEVQAQLVVATCAVLQAAQHAGMNNGMGVEQQGVVALSIISVRDDGMHGRASELFRVIE